MKKKIIVLGVIILITVVGLSGCNENNIITVQKPTYYTPDYVLSNKETFLKKGEIIIEGYYDANVVEGGGIVSTLYLDPGSGEPTNGLRLDITNVEDTSNLSENIILYFNGTLVKDETDPLSNAVIFQATNICKK